MSKSDGSKKKTSTVTTEITILVAECVSRGKLARAQHLHSNAVSPAGTARRQELVRAVAQLTIQILQMEREDLSLVM